MLIHTPKKIALQNVIKLFYPAFFIRENFFMKVIMFKILIQILLAFFKGNKITLIGAELKNFQTKSSLKKRNLIHVL